MAPQTKPVWIKPSTFSVASTIPVKSRKIGRTALLIALIVCLSPVAGWAQFEHLAAAQKLALEGQGLLYTNGDNDGAIAKEREAIGLYPDLVLAHTTLALALYMKHDSEGSLKEYREALRLDSENAEAHNGVAEILVNQGDLKGAQDEYKKACELEPENDQYKSDYRLFLEKWGDSVRAPVTDAPKAVLAGEELINNDDVDGGIAKFREAVRLDPNLRIAHEDLANWLQIKEDKDGSLKEYREVLRLEPNNASAHQNVGLLLQNKDDQQGALEEYRTACALDPGNAQYKALYDNLLKSGPLLAGEDLFNKKDYDGAIAKLREALRLDPNQPVAHLYLAAALASKRDWDHALNEYREVLRLEPNHVTAHLGLGYVLAWKNDWDGAIKEDREVLSLAPNNGDAHYQLGQALEGKGDQKGALEESRAACALDPKNIVFQSHLEMLQERMRELRPIDEALRQGAKSGDLDKVLNLLDQGANIDATNKKGETALMWAAYWGQTEVVDMLIRKRANVNAKANEWEGQGDTPLTYAVDAALAAEGSWNTVVMNAKGDLPGWESRHLAVVKLLVYWGADVDTANLFGESALNMAFSRSTGQISNRYNLDFLEVLMGGKLPPPPPDFQ